MAKLHIYVRVQAQLSAADAQVVEDLLTRSREVVEAAGNEWHGAVTTQLDDDEVVPAAPAPKAAAKPVEPAEPVKPAKSLNPDHRSGPKAKRT